MDKQLKNQKVNSPLSNETFKNDKCTDNALEFTNGFLAIDLAFTIKYCSEEILRFVSLPIEQLVGQQFWTIVETVKTLSWLLPHKKDIATGKTSKVKFLCPNTKIWLEASFSASTDGYSIFLSNISTSELLCEEIENERYKYRQLFDENPVPQWVYDTDTLAFLEVNAAAIAQYGYSYEEFMAMTIRDIRPKTELKTLENLLLGLQNTTKFRRVFSTHQLKNGDIRYVKVESNAFPYPKKNARIVLALDFTEQQLAQNALADSERRFKSLVQHGSDLIAIMDQSLNYIYVNEATETVLGLVPEELIGKNALHFVHNDDRQMLLVLLEDLSANEPLKLPPFRFTDSEGNYRWIETILTNMTSDPSVNGLVANSRDITENVVNRMISEENIERYEIIAEATSDAIWDYDIESDTIVWNKGIKGIFGHEIIKCSTDWFKNQVHPDDLEQSVVKTYLAATAKGKSRLIREFRFKCADGSYKSVLDRSFIIFDAAQNPVRMIGSMQDVTPTNNYIQAIEQQNKKLQEISWLQSHSVRAPLASILGLTQLIQCPKSADDDMMQTFKYIKSSAEELDGVINNIIKKAHN